MASNGFQEFLNKIQTLSEEKVQKWWEIVTNMMGVDSDNIREWNSIFETQIQELYDEMIDEAVSKRDRMLNKIEQLLQKSSVLCKELSIKMPEYGSQSLTLFEEQEYLVTKVAEYDEKVNTLKQIVKKLNKEESSLCNSLGQNPKVLTSQPLPSDEIIAAFKSYLEELESKKFEREEHYLMKKSDITDLVKKLNYKPSLDIERIILSEDDSSFLVTDVNMNKLNEFYDSLKKQYENLQEDIFNLRDKLKSLWDLLSEDWVMRDGFLEKHTEYNVNTLMALQAEVKRCENLKKANIEVFVQRLRDELKALWDKCHMTENDRSKFIYFNSDTYSEDLLSIHDLEIEKMKDFYKSNNELFKLLEKRSQLWDRMIVLEESASKPDRFKNRGGELLREEKERNGIAKRLPKIEEQLMDLGNSFKLKYGKPFCTWGKTIEEVIGDAHYAHEEKKKLKLSVRKQKRDQTPSRLISKSVSTQNLLTPKSALKRKQLTPLEGSCAKILLREHNEKAQTVPSKIRSNVKVGGPSRYNTERSKRIEKCRRISQRMLQKQKDKENLPKYDMFKKDLGSKDGCRSTLFPNLEESNNLLAEPLPDTPKVNNLGSTHKKPTPQKTNTAGPTKLTTAPCLKILF